MIWTPRLERRPFKSIEYLGQSSGCVGNRRPSRIETTSTKRDFKTLVFVADVDDDETQSAFAITIDHYLFVYNSDGTVRWSVALDRYTAGYVQHQQGLCFGLDQDVYVGWVDFYVDGSRQGYIFHYDRDGNFLSERPAALVGDYFKRSLVCSPNGLVLLSHNEVGTLAGVSLSSDAEYHLAYNSTDGNSNLAFDGDDNVYCVARTTETGRCFWKWDADGELISSVPSSYANGLLAVSEDGTCAWTATLWTLVGSQLEYRFYRVDLATGSLLEQVTRLVDDPIYSIRLTPWGELLWSGNDVDASQVDGNQLKAFGSTPNLSGSGWISGLFFKNDVEIWRGSPFASAVHCVATSLT